MAPQTQTQSANEIIQKKQISHLIYTQRYSSSVIKQMSGVLKGGIDDIEALLEKRIQRIIKAGGDRGPFTTQRMGKMLKELREMQKAAYAAITDEASTHLKDFAVYERDFQAEIIQTAIPLDDFANITMPSVATVRSAALSRPFQGRHLRGWTKNLLDTEYDAVRTVIKNGIATGQTTPQIISRVRNKIDIKRHQAESIVRTAVNHTANRAKGEVVKANPNLVKGLKVVATLDTRTSSICREYDGRLLDADTLDLPPYHINCRSTYTTVLKGWKELGIDLNEAPAGTRASLNGQVPADLHYNEWLKTAPKTDVVAALGPRRAKLFLEGSKNIKFQSNDGIRYTLDQLKAKEPKAWAKAFGDAA